MTQLRVTFGHEGHDVDLEIRVDGTALAGGVVDAVIDQGQVERTPPVPSFTGRVLSRVMLDALASVGV